MGTMLTIEIIDDEEAILYILQKKYSDSIRTHSIEYAVSKALDRRMSKEEEARLRDL